jgi:hypothetical protein
MKYFPRRSSVLVVLLFAILAMSASASNSQATVTSQVQRSVAIPVKVVLIGFEESQVDIDYLAWKGSGKNLPEAITNVDLDAGNATGVIFRPQYSFSFAPEEFKQSLLDRLRSIERQTSGDNPWFGQWQIDPENEDYYVSVPLSIDYVVYDADLAEEWLWNHGQDLGGYPEDGWTLVLAYLPELPSVSWSDVREFKRTNGQELPKTMPHYYGISRVDSDLGYKLRYRDLMNAWGGHHRLWFVDLAAGPVWNSEWEDLPLQVALGDNDIDLSSQFGRKWVTEYLADYVWQATYNFVAPNFVYSPKYAPNYLIDIVVLDDRTAEEKRAVPIENTVNKDKVVDAFRDLLPYSEIDVELEFQTVSQDLHRLIESGYKFTDSWIMGSVFGSPERYGVVDVRPVYNYLLGCVPDSDSADDTVVVPVFAFALSERTYFTYTYKWMIGDQDWETGALLGIAFREAAIISLNQWEFTRGNLVDPPQTGKGIGFTQTIIHELGHEFGLMHPHQYGYIGDFVFSAMGYYTDDCLFGQIDKDAIQRAHVDQIRAATMSLLDAIVLADGGSSVIAQAQDKLSESDSLYRSMRYCEAIEPALEAYGIASEASPGTATETLTQAPSSLALEQTFAQPTVAYVVGALVFGLAVGFGIAYAVTRRSKVEERPVKAQVAARPDLKWCYKCGARRAADSSFCEECGTSFT